MLISDEKSGPFVAGADGCSSGWVALILNVRTGASSVQLTDVASWIRERPDGLAMLAIDIPIGLIDGTRPCDSAARKLLGLPRCCSVFPAPCRATILPASYPDGSAVNFAITGKKLSKQTWAIGPKIKEIDDVIQPDHQAWVYEVHPEVSFWRLNNGRAMKCSKSRPAGREERRSVLSRQFPEIDRHIAQRPKGVGVDDVLDAAVAAWSAMRLWEGSAEMVCAAGLDNRELRVAIHY